MSVQSSGRGFRLETFRAVLDRIIPEDDFPGALQCGVDRFILSLWDAGLVVQGEIIAEGLRRLDEGVASSFGDLAREEQDALLAGLADQRWFAILCELAAEGFYADPGNGANPGAVSWRMIGYRPGLPEGPSGPAENQDDAVRGKLWA